MNLYQISEELESIFDELVRSEGELTPELEAKLDRMDGAFEVKAENIALVVKSKEALNSARDTEIKRLQADKRADEAAITRLEKYLYDQMIRVDKGSIVTAKATIKITTTPLKTIVPETQALLESFFHKGDPFISQITEYKVDKAELLKAIKAQDPTVPAWAKAAKGSKLTIK